MNESGKAVAEIVQFYKLDPSKDILVIHDEKDLPLGTIRPTDNSSSAGHNGVQSIIDHLGNQKFHRIRIGVESREPDSPIPTDVFVLENFTPEESNQFNLRIMPEGGTGHKVPALQRE
jgi:PTH1 family peptidyl-tRNA hydrolase